jgi:hypothetical protein
MPAEELTRICRDFASPNMASATGATSLTVPLQAPVVRVLELALTAREPFTQQVSWTRQLWEISKLKATHIQDYL